MWTYEITNEPDVPTAYREDEAGEPSGAKLRAAVAAGVRDIPGVRIYREANDYERKQEARRERLEAAATRQEAEALARFGRADRLAGVINGQPILVGHHSEKRARRDQERIHGDIRKGCEASKEAEALHRRAEAVGSAGISSDDPEAVAKLRDELAHHEEQRELMLDVNKRHAAYLKRPASLDESLIDEALKAKIRAYVPRYSWEPHPFAPWQLTNLGVNIRRIKARIIDLERVAFEPEREPVEGKGWRVEDDKAANRVRVTFASKPSADICGRLRRAGFHFSRHEVAWLRHRSNAAWAFGLEAVRGGAANDAAVDNA